MLMLYLHTMNRVDSRYINRTFNPTTQGFTIVELLVVIVIIGILAAITIVSYSGISSRANVASIQSDLTNASILLKMDQTSGDSFPATLALANDGRGITPSQSLDSVVCIPDNASNPKNFCLMYKKGNDNYALDNNSSSAKGVCLINLVTNSDFSSGTSGWTTEHGAITTSAGTATATADGTSYYSTIDRVCNNCAVNGHKVYAILKQMVTNSSAGSIGVMISDSVGNKNLPSISNPVMNNWYTNSGIVTFTGSGNMAFKPVQSYVDAATANGKEMEIQYIVAIDLTATFGAGNELSKAQMDTIMSGYANNWFNIVSKLSM